MRSQTTTKPQHPVYISGLRLTNPAIFHCFRHQEIKMWQVSPELSWFSWLAASTEAALALLSCLLWPGLLPEEADSTLISEASCLEEFEFLQNTFFLLPTIHCWLLTFPKCSKCLWKQGKFSFILLTWNNFYSSIINLI